MSASNKSQQKTTATPQTAHRNNRASLFFLHEKSKTTRNNAGASPHYFTSGNP